MIRRVIFRIISTVFGFILAVAAGGFTLFALGMSWAAAEAAGMPAEHPDEFAYRLHEGLGMIAFFMTVAPVLTLLPAIALAVAGELARIRSAFYYIAAGGIAAALMPFFASRETGAQGGYTAEYFAILATAGFAGGFVYWLIAGRNA